MPEITLPANTPVLIATVSNTVRFEIVNTTPSPTSGCDVHLSASGGVSPANDLAVVAPGGSRGVTVSGPLYAWSARATRIEVRGTPVADGSITGAATSLSGGGVYPALEVYNAAGLANFRAALASRTSVGQGGVAIVAGPGDSIEEGGIVGGAGAATPIDYLTGRWSHVLAKALAAVYNQGGRVGLGFVPLSAGADAVGWLKHVFTKDGTFSADGSASNTPGLARRLQTIAGGASGRARIAFDPFIHPSLACTDLELVFSGSAVTGSLQVDVSAADAFVASGAGATSFLQSTVISGLAFGVRSQPAQLQGMDRTLARTIQFTNAGAGDVYPDGVFHYDGNRDSGVSVFNIARWGDTVFSNADTGGNNYAASFDIFGSMAGPYASSRAGLFILNWITNDQAGNVPIGTFKSKVLEQVDRALACPSAPSVLLMPPPPKTGTSYAARLPYVQALKEIVDARAARCALIDLAQMIGYRTHGAAAPGGAVYDAGWWGDGTHYNGAWQIALGNRLATTLRG